MRRSNGHEERCRTVETLYELYHYANLHMGTHTMKYDNVEYCRKRIRVIPFLDDQMLIL